jgi:hypothetical protein
VCPQPSQLAYFDPNLTEDGEVSKRPQLTPPYLPHHLYRRRPRGEAGANYPTTYIEYGLVGKSVNVRNLHPLSSPQPIQKQGSWGSSGQLPHHLYRIRPRGEARGPTSPPPIQRSGEVPLLAPPHLSAAASGNSAVRVVAFVPTCVRPSGVPVRPPSPPPPCAHVIGLRGRRRGPSLTAARGFSTIR